MFVFFSGRLANVVKLKRHCFVLVQCNFRYVCSHEGMGRPPSRRDSTKQHPPMRRRANNKQNSHTEQSRHQQYRHRREHLRLRLRQHKPITRPKLLLQPVRTSDASSLQPLRFQHGRTRVRLLGAVNRKRIIGTLLIFCNVFNSTTTRSKASCVNDLVLDSF